MAASAVGWSDYELGTFYRMSDVEEPVVARAAPAVVYFSGATGFIVSPEGHILTNHHVYESFGNAGTVRRHRVDGSRGRRLRVKLVTQNRKFDVALYKAVVPAGTALPWLPMRTSPPRVGEDVFVLGHPDSKPLRASFGRVLAKDIVIGGRPSVEYSAQTWWGSSGSPVIDRQGRVFAIHWGWDSDGLSNGRLTGVPFHLITRALPAIAAVANGSPPNVAARAPVPAACRLPSAWGITTALIERDASTNARGRSLDDIEVRLAPRRPECLRHVSNVTYTLHPTFNDPVVRGDRSGRGFPIRLGAWGYFEAKAEIEVAGAPVEVSGMVRWN